MKDYVMWFARILALVCKGLIAALFPLTGDELYYWTWSKQLALGYYDHPPMVAWWVALSSSFLGDAPWAVRLPWVCAGVLLAMGVGAAVKLRTQSPERARAAELMTLFLPLELVFVFVSPDMPLWLFGFVGTLCFTAALESTAPLLWMLGAGVFSGLGFLSKFSMIFWMLGMLVYTTIKIRENKLILSSHLIKLVLTFSVGFFTVLAPFFWWNVQHHFAPFLFHGVLRHKIRSEFSWSFLGMFLVFCALISAPLGGLLKHVRRLEVFCFSVLLLCIFAISAFSELPSLHWLLQAVPWLIVGAARSAPMEQLHRAQRHVMRLGIAGVLLIVVGVSVAPLWLHHWSRYPEAVWFIQPTQWIESVHTEARAHLTESELEKAQWASRGYTLSALLSYALGGREVVPLGQQGVMGRQSDLTFDWMAHDQKTFLIWGRGLGEGFEEEYQPWFASVKCSPVAPFEGVHSTLCIAKGFKARLYLDQNGRYRPLENTQALASFVLK